jgi:putative membrane protein
MPHHQHPLLRVVIALVVITALAALVAYLVVRFSNRRGPAPAMSAPPPAMAMAGAPAGDAALDQLRMRYARGDVSRADYLQAAADLGAPVPEAPPPPTNPL